MTKFLGFEKYFKQIFGAFQANIQQFETSTYFYNPNHKPLMEGRERGVEIVQISPLHPFKRLILVKLVCFSYRRRLCSTPCSSAPGEKIEKLSEHILSEISRRVTLYLTIYYDFSIFRELQAQN